MATKTILSEQGILDKFRVEKEAGPGEYLAYCNVHDDQNNPNCRITFTPSQVLSYCFACGAKGKEQFKAAGLDPKYLFKENWGNYQQEKFSLKGLAGAKGLPLEFMKGLGVYERNNRVIIPYKDRSGDLIREKARTAWRATEGSRWIGKGNPATYGKWLLDRMRKKHDHLILVEGETDSWTLWQHELPALGVPGANMTKHIQPEDIKGFDKLCLWQESDPAGADFVNNCRKRLNKLDYQGKVYLIHGRDFGTKDANELYLLDSEGFEGNIEDIISEAKEIDLNSEIEVEDSTEWPDPIPFNNYESKEMPAEILPDWQQDFARNLSDFTQTPVDMSVLLILSATATALSNKAVIEVRKGYTESLNIWTCAVLPPASRKSAVFKKITQPIIDYEIEQEEKLATKIAGIKNEIEIKEDRQKKLKTKAANSAKREELLKEINEIDGEIREKKEDCPRIPRLIANDITPEKIAFLLKNNYGRLALMDSEGTVFKIMAGRYSQNSDVSLEIINKGWTGGESLRVDRISRDSITVENPAITQGLTIQPRVLQALKQKESFKGEGTIGRFLYSIPKSNIGNRLTGDKVPGLGQDILKRYQRGMQVLLKTRPKEEEKDEWKPYIMKLSPAAREVRNELAADIEERLGPEGGLHFMRDWGGKLVGNVTRIAGLIHIAAQQVDADSDRSDRDIFGQPITGEAMQAARTLAEALIPHAKKLYDLLDSDPRLKLARYVLGRIQDGKRKEKAGELPKDKEELDRSALYEMTRDKKEIKTPKNLEKSLELLQELNHIKLEKRSGRKTPLIKLNPKLDTNNTNNPINSNSEGPADSKSGKSGRSGKVCKEKTEDLKGVIEI